LPAAVKKVLHRWEHRCAKSLWQNDRVAEFPNRQVGSRSRLLWFRRLLVLQIAKASINRCSPAQRDGRDLRLGIGSAGRRGFEDEGDREGSHAKDLERVRRFYEAARAVGTHSIE